MAVGHGAPARQVAQVVVWPIQVRYSASSSRMPGRIRGSGARLPLMVGARSYELVRGNRNELVRARHEWLFPTEVGDHRGGCVYSEGAAETSCNGFGRPFTIKPLGRDGLPPGVYAWRTFQKVTLLLPRLE